MIKNDIPEDTSAPEGMRTVDGDLAQCRGKILPDIIYATKDGKDLRLRILQPARLDEPLRTPLIMHVQGSGWMMQNMNDHVLDLAPYVRKGYTVAIVEYRHSALAAFPAQIEDAKTAMRYLNNHAEALGLDMSHVYLSGDSSGGHTVLGCMITWADHRLDEEDTELPKLSGVIDYYGPTDLTTMPDFPSRMNHTDRNSPEGLICGGYDLKEHPGKAIPVSLKTYMHEGLDLPPLLMLHGSKDRIVPCHQSVEFYELMKSYGYDVTFIKVLGAGHGGSAFWCDNVCNAVSDFLDAHK